MKLPAELLASLESGELAAYLVAADWLISQGDPWGELINAQCRLEGATDPSVFVTFKKQADALLKQHGERWLGARVAAAWHRGFVERVELDDVELLPRVLASDVGGLLRDLAVRGTPSEIERALRSVRGPRLRGLALNSTGLSEPVLSGVEGLVEDGRTEESSRGRSSTGLDRPERLELQRVALDARFDCSALKWLSVADAPVRSEVPSALERLELLEVDTPLRPIVERQTNLRVLHLEDDLPDDLARWLADSPAISRLDHLALGGPFTDDGLDAILKRFARFSRLKTLVLYGGVFGPTIRKWAYKQLPQLTIERRRPGPGWPGHPRHGIRLSPPPGP
jgi:uncharacterized protein (TIGR02996 family)